MVATDNDDDAKVARLIITTMINHRNKNGDINCDINKHDNGTQ